MNESSFYGLGIAPNILAILDKNDFKVPTPIQSQSIPQLIEGKDLIGIAQTGTGKTLAFGIPMLQAALAGKKGLIVLPTRELAIQVQEAFAKIGLPLGIRTALIIGGDPMGRQVQAIRRGPMIIIGTPGRIIDHLEQKTFTLASAEMLVLDEADRMLDMGFAPQLKRILLSVPKERQTMLFSATMPDDIVAIARTHMKTPTRVEIAPQGTAATRVTQELFFVHKMDKHRLLEKLLQEYRGSVLVFSRTKHGAKKIATGIRSLGHSVTELHSNRSPSQRRESMEGFRNAKYRVLVATDIAARGIDVKGIELVLNYDLPDNAEDYVHRIGRTGRAGGVGHAISFATPEQRGDVRGIERLIRAALPLSKLPTDLPPPRPLPPMEEDVVRPRYGAGRSSRPSGPRKPYGSSSRAPRSFGSRPYGPSKSGPSKFGPSKFGPRPAPKKFGSPKFRPTGA